VYKYLIEVKGCDVNVQAKNKNTPLYNALCCFNPNKGGDITVLTYLLSQKGVDPNIKDVHGCTLLHAAFENINALPIEVFKLVIGTHGGDVIVKDNNEHIPLYYALFCFDPNLGGDTAVLTYLLHQKGVNGDINDKSRSTLLHAACNNINKLPLEIFQDLIETHGFDVNTQDNYKNTPVHLALRYFNPNDGGDITVLMYLFSQKGINTNIKGHLGSTLLHIACKMINKFPLDVFKLLIETHGGDVNVQDDDKNTPLHDALYRFDPRNGGNITALMYLLTQMNTNVNTKGFNGETLLHKACERINTVPLEIFKLLIEIKGCDVNIQDNDENTPLRTALRYFNPNSDIAVLTYLFTQKGINGNIKSYNDYLTAYGLLTD
jgi:ankyrin repeat protein